MALITSHKKADAASLFNIYQIGTLPVKTDQLRLQTMQDPVLAKVLNYTQNGWPSSVEPDLKPFFDRRLEITIEAGCLMCMAFNQCQNTRLLIIYVGVV